MARTNWAISILLPPFISSEDYITLYTAGQLNYLNNIYVSRFIKTAVAKRRLNQRDISGKPTSAHPYLICSAGLGQISHPFDTMVVTLFEYLQKAHDQTRRGKHKNLEIDVYGWSSPDLAGSRARKLCSPIKCELLSPLDSRDPAQVRC